MKAILIAIFVLFDAYTFYAIYQVGYLGIIEAGLVNPGSLQVLLDLVIACSLIAWWMVNDARANGRNPWPYLIITLFGGSLGPLLYLILAGERSPAVASGAVQRA
jgi:hypothetical protein